MKTIFPRIPMLLFSIIVLYSCKDDEQSGYVPLNIVANADTGEVFQNSSLEIAVFANDTNVPEDGEITLTAPQSGTALISNNGTPTNILDDKVLYTPNEIGRASCRERM